MLLVLQVTYILIIIVQIDSVKQKSKLILISGFCPSHLHFPRPQIIIRFITQRMQPHTTYTSMMHQHTNKLHAKTHTDDKINLKYLESNCLHKTSPYTIFHSRQAHHSAHTWLPVPVFHTSL